MNELMELRQLAQQTDNQKAVSLYNKVDKEIERLNNIIKILDDYVISDQMFEYGNTREEAEQYLQKLKGSDRK